MFWKALPDDVDVCIEAGSNLRTSQFLIIANQTLKLQAGFKESGLDLFLSMTTSTAARATQAMTAMTTPATAPPAMPGPLVGSTPLSCVGSVGS